MERLTTRNSMGVPVYKEPYSCENCNDIIWRLSDYGNGSPTDRLADYEDAEEQGLLLRLPVAEGSVVYTIRDHFDSEYDYDYPLGYAEGKYNCEEGLCCNHEHKKYSISEARFHHRMLEKIGKTVFLKREEAEQALADMQCK